MKANAEDRTKEELLDDLLVSGVLTAEEYAKKLTFVQRSSSSPSTTSARFAEEDLDILDVSGHVRAALHKRSEEVNFALQREREKCMRTPLDTLRKVQLEVKSCEKSVDNSARNLLAAERELGRIQAVLDAIADNVSKLSQSTARVNIKPVE